MADKKKVKPKGGLLGRTSTKSELNKQRVEAIKKGDFKKVKEIQKKLKAINK